MPHSWASEMVVGEEAVLTEEMNSRVVWGVEWRGNTDLVVGVGFEVMVPAHLEP